MSRHAASAATPTADPTDLTTLSRRELYCVRFVNDRRRAQLARLVDDHRAADPNAPVRSNLRLIAYHAGVVRAVDEEFARRGEPRVAPPDLPDVDPFDQPTDPTDLRRARSGDLAALLLADRDGRPAPLRARIRVGPAGPAAVRAELYRREVGR